MKTNLYLLAIALIGAMSVSNAQDQNPECLTNLSIFNEHAKVKNFDAAYEPWKMVYDNCPSLNRATFSQGEKILKDRIAKASAADKDAAIADLDELYKNSMKYFPKRFKMAAMMTKEVLFKYDNKMLSDEEIYEGLHKAFTEDKPNFKNPKALYLYFSSLVNLHKAGGRELQLVFDTYDDVTEKIEVENKKLIDQIAKLLPKEEANTLSAKEKRRLRIYSTNSESFGKIAGSIDTKLGDLANCENLIPLYQKSFDAKKNDVVWVKRAVGRMFAKECTDDPLFVQLVEAQNALAPTADTYFYLGLLKQKAKDTKGAVADFNKAVELEADADKKANILYKIASIYRRGSKSTARSYARKAIDANPSMGKAYLLIASLYPGSANDCGSTTFEKRALYWKAAEMARKAGRVDPSLRGRANAAAASYNAKAPSKTDIFNAGMAGKSVTFSCWVGGSVKVPNL